MLARNSMFSEFSPCFLGFHTGSWILRGRKRCDWSLTPFSPWKSGLWLDVVFWVFCQRFWGKKEKIAATPSLLAPLRLSKELLPLVTFQTSCNGLWSSHQKLGSLFLLAWIFNVDWGFSRVFVILILGLVLSDTKPTHTLNHSVWWPNVPVEH